MSDQKLTVVATILAVEEKREILKAELIKLLAPTRAEEGCLSYVLQQDNDNQNLFLFHETWESKTHWQKHSESAHIQAYRTATEGAVAEFLINEMTHIEA